MVVPGTFAGSPARKAATRPRLLPVAPSGKPTPITTSSTSAGSTLARSTACLTTLPASVAPCVWLNAPRNDLPIGVRAAETITASRMCKLLRVFCERSSAACDLGQQRRRRPVRTEALSERHDLVVDPRHTELVGVPHGPTMVRREAVAVDVDDIDVARPQSDAVAQEIGAGVDQRVHRALDDLFVAHVAALGDAGLRGLFREELLDLGIAHGIAAALLVRIEPDAGLLSQSLQL